jgi:parallel beta-helix repeat protein
MVSTVLTIPSIIAVQANDITKPDAPTIDSIYNNEKVGAITIGWTRVTDAIKYRVYGYDYTDLSQTTNEQELGITYELIFTDNTLPHDRSKKKRYKVTSIDAWDNETDILDEDAVKYYPLDSSDPPYLISLNPWDIDNTAPVQTLGTGEYNCTLSALTNGSIKISWIAFTDTQSDVAGYNIWRFSGTQTHLDKILIGTVGTKNILEYTDATTIDGIVYHYFVTAFDGSGNESLTSNNDVNWQSITSNNTINPSSPIGLTATGGSGRIDLSWIASSDSDNIVKYEIQKTEDSGTLPDQTGVTSTQIKLDSNASSVDDYYNNKRIYVSTDEGQDRLITDYVGSTRIATVSAWTTQPVERDNYYIDWHCLENYIVTIADIAKIYGNTKEYNAIYDLNKDGVIDLYDLTLCSQQGGVITVPNTDDLYSYSNTNSYSEYNVTDTKSNIYKWRYRVRAINSTSNPSDWCTLDYMPSLVNYYPSNGHLPGTPDKPTVTALYDGSIKITWLKPTTTEEFIQYYLIYRREVTRDELGNDISLGNSTFGNSGFGNVGYSVSDSVCVANISAPSLEYIDTYLERYKEYKYSVVAIEFDGNKSERSEDSDGVFATDKIAPDIDKVDNVNLSLTATGIFGAIKLTWNEVDGENGETYEIWRCLGEIVNEVEQVVSGETYSKIATINGSANNELSQNSFIDSAPESNIVSTYFYKIKAVDSWGNHFKTDGITENFTTAVSATSKDHYDSGIVVSSATFVIGIEGVHKTADYYVPITELTSAQIKINEVIGMLPEVGGNITLLQGNYHINERILLPSNINFILQQGATIYTDIIVDDIITVFQNADTTNGNENIIIQGGSIKYTNGVITSSKTYPWGIRFFKVNNFTIKNMTIGGVQNAHGGICLDNCTEVDITGMTFNLLATSISITYGDTFKINKNNFIDSINYCELNYCDNSIISDNIFINSNITYVPIHGLISCTLCDNINIINNIINYSFMDGIYLNQCTKININLNKIKNSCEHGIFLYFCNICTVNNNEIEGSGGNVRYGGDDLYSNIFLNGCTNSKLQTNTCRIGDCIIKSGILPSQTGLSLNQIKLDSTASTIDDYYLNYSIFVSTDGGQNRPITAYNGTTKICTLLTNWTTQPVENDTYNIQGRPQYGINISNSSCVNTLVSNNVCFNSGVTKGINNISTSTLSGAGNIVNNGTWSLSFS